MKLLILGRPYFADALRRQGHELFVINSVGDAGIADVAVTHPWAPGRLQSVLDDNSFTPDACLYCDDGCLPAILGLENMPFPSVFLSIDTFCNPWHVPYAHAFDHIWVAQRDFLPLFWHEKHAASWFPLFAKAALASGMESSPEEWLAQRDIPVAFVGTLSPKNIPQRLPFLKTFRTMQPLLMMQGAYVPIFKRARIVLNQSASSEVNFRCFEAMMCGAALLHDSVGHGYDDLFAISSHVLPPYIANNAASAAETTKQWLDNPKQLAEMALSGMRLVADKHSDEARAKEAARLCHRLAMQHQHEQRLATLDRRRYFLASAYGTLAAELGEDMKALRDLYQQVCVDLGHSF